MDKQVRFFQGRTKPWGRFVGGVATVGAVDGQGLKVHRGQAPRKPKRRSPRLDIRPCRPSRRSSRQSGVWLGSAEREALASRNGSHCQPEATGRRSPAPVLNIGKTIGEDPPRLATERKMSLGQTGHTVRAAHSAACVVMPPVHGRTMLVPFLHATRF